MTDKQNSWRVNRSSENTSGMKFSYASLNTERMHFFQIDIDVRAVDLFSDSVSPHRTSMEEGLGTNTIELDFALHDTFSVYFGYFPREYSPFLPLYLSHI